MSFLLGKRNERSGFFFLAGQLTLGRVTGETLAETRGRLAADARAPPCGHVLPALYGAALTALPARVTEE